jgi:hypothetical protein
MIKLSKTLRNVLPFASSKSRFGSFIDIKFESNIHSISEVCKSVAIELFDGSK